MKLQPLLIAVALVTGASFAQAPNGSAKAPADMPAASATTSADQSPAKVHKKKVANKKHATRHASAQRHGTHSMGAGPTSPSTDLNAAAREHRMDQAYNDWMAQHR